MSITCQKFLTNRCQRLFLLPGTVGDRRRHGADRAPAARERTGANRKRQSTALTFGNLPLNAFGIGTTFFVS
jgi:hypothetical protein